MATKLEHTTVSDFGGGWNVADSPLNLSTKFQPVSENILRGVNGSFQPRWGDELSANARDGTEDVVVPAGDITVNVTNALPYVRFTVTAHGYSDGDHITLPDTIVLASGSLGTIPIDALHGTHGIDVVDANNFRIATRFNATSTTSGTLTIPEYTIDDHTLAGNIIHMAFFKAHMVLFDDIGEIATMNVDTHVVTRIWDIVVANAITANLPPTRHCDFISTTTFKSTLISCNGYDNDKPLQIDEDFNVEFLVDKATLSNAFVPRADIVIGMSGYVIFMRTEFGDPFIEFSARNTDGTFTRDPAPDDSVEIDLSMVTDTIEPTILGAGPMRDKLYVAFYDRGMVGTIGVYNSATPPEHVPEFNDTIAEHGTVSHRTVVPLGNDIFMADYAGVPSVSISIQSGGLVPIRLSELIAPAIQAHLGKLSEETLRIKAFGLFNKSDRMYMLFLPKYDEMPQMLDDDPLRFNIDMSAVRRVMVIAPRHGLFESSFVTVAGAPTIDQLDASKINGVRRVAHVIDSDTFIMELADDAIMPPNNVVEGGGTGITITPVNDETIGYGFEFNKELKIRRWTRIRGFNFACGAATARGRVYFAKGGRVFRYGNAEEPLEADNINLYDSVWANSTLYTVGAHIFDDVNNKTYECLVEHTSAAADTFADDRELNPDNWMEWVGDPIEWDLETPWSDFQKRGNYKLLKYVSFDTEGSDDFTFELYSNQIYRDRQTYARVPNRSMNFTAGDYGGFGIKDADQFGSGRRTKEEKVWPMPVKAKLFKMRFHGSTTRRVRISGVTLYYLEAGVR